MKKSFGSRGGQGRPRGKTPQQSGTHHNQSLVGVYQNERLINSVAAVSGCVTQVILKDGKIFEGILKTISPDGALVLHKAFQVDQQQQNGVVAQNSPTTYDHFLVNHKTWVKVNFKDVDLEECCKKEFKIDGAIASSKKMNGQSNEPEKELKKWEFDNNDQDESLERPGTMANGWTPAEMFHTNADKYGVQTCFDETLPQYTTPLEKSDTPEFKEREKKAAQIAQEIIQDSQYEQSSFDSGRSDEALYSSVLRGNSNSANWRDRSDQRTQKISREGSRSPAPRSPAMSKKLDASKTNQTEAVSKPQHKERIVKNTTEPEPKQESKVEAAVDTSSKETKPSQSKGNEAVVKPETATVTKPDSAITTTVAPTVSATNDVIDKEEKEKTTKSLKEFSANFQLSEKADKGKTKNVQKPKEIPEEKKAEEKIEEIKETVSDVEPQTEEPKTEVETSPVKKVESILNPNAKEFRPSSVKTTTPSPRSSSTPSSGGTASPFQAQSPYAGIHQYPVHPGALGMAYRPRHRGNRQEFEQPFVNAVNAAGQPLFAQPMVPFVQQNNIPFIPARHPAAMPPFLVTGQGNPVIVPVSTIPGPYADHGQMYYGPPSVQVLQSPPQVQSPSSQFTFPTPQPAMTPSNVRAGPQIPQPTQQQPILLQPTQIINRPPAASNYQAN